MRTTIRWQICKTMEPTRCSENSVISIYRTFNFIYKIIISRPTKVTFLPTMRIIQFSILSVAEEFIFLIWTNDISYFPSTISLYSLYQINFTYLNICLSIVNNSIECVILNMKGMCCFNYGKSVFFWKWKKGLKDSFYI